MYGKIAIALAVIAIAVFIVASYHDYTTKTLQSLDQNCKLLKNYKGLANNQIIIHDVNSGKKAVYTQAHDGKVQFCLYEYNYVHSPFAPALFFIALVLAIIAIGFAVAAVKVNRK